MATIDPSNLTIYAEDPDIQRVLDAFDEHCAEDEDISEETPAWRMAFGDGIVHKLPSYFAGASSLHEIAARFRDYADQTGDNAALLRDEADAWDLLARLGYRLTRPVTANGRITVIPPKARHARR